MPAAPNNDFDALVEAWLVSQRSNNTRAAYGRDILYFEAWVVTRASSPLRATTADIEAFRCFCEDAGASVATVNRRLAAISSFFRFHASHRAVRSHNPVDAASRPAAAVTSSTPHLDPGQAINVWRASIRVGPRAASIVGLMLFDGLKANETLLLDVEHLGRFHRSVSADVERRGGRQTFVLDRRTASAVLGCVGDRSSGPLLLGESPTRESARLSRFGLGYLLKRSGEMAGLQKTLTANMLRSTHISESHDGGMPLHDLREVVGHASVRTTRRYVIIGKADDRSR